MFYTNNIFGLNCGRFVIYTGNMFGGKSEALVGNVRTVSREENIRVKSAKREGQIIDPLSIGVFKPIIDNRYSTESVVTHDGKELPCVPVYTVDELVDYIEEHDVRVIAIDEIQFLNDKDENGHYKIVQAVHRFLQEKRYVIASGLKLDFRGLAFEPMDKLLPIACFIQTLNSRCAVCGDEAPLPQRFVNGEPAHFDDPVVLVGAEESYEPRCRRCHVVKTGARETSIEHTAEQHIS